MCSARSFIGGFVAAVGIIASLIFGVGVGTSGAVLVRVGTHVCVAGSVTAGEAPTFHCESIR